jgi:4-amino-4-deoxy-L-arabinose transferase-like glycosyltransferase
VRAAVFAAGFILLFAAFLSFRGIDREKYASDEALWILQGQKYWPLFSSGQWDRGEWDDFDSSWGTPNPPVAKYLLGFGLSAQNAPEWKWDRGKPPPSSVLSPARSCSAIAGLVGCAGILLIGLLSVPPRAALYSALFLATSPTWIVASRHAMTDVYGATLAILAVVPFLLAMKEIEGKSRAGIFLAWIALSGILAGTAVGAKLNAASTPTALGLVLLILFLRELVLRRELRRAVLLFFAGFILAGTAVGTFLGTNPHLHEDSWNRFSEMIGWWTNMTESRVALAERTKLRAFLPQNEGVRVFFGKLFFPPKAISLLLLMPVAIAFVFRRTRAAYGHLAAWTLLSIAVAVVGLWPNQLLHPWLLWLGVLGAIISLLLRANPQRVRALRLSTFAVLVWGIISAFFVWRMTFIPWARYYIPALPGLALLAGFGLATLREELRVAAGSWPAKLIDAAMVFSALAIAAAFPNYDAGRVQDISKAGGALRGIFLWLTVASMGAAIALAWIRVKRPYSRAFSLPGL